MDIESSGSTSPPPPGNKEVHVDKSSEGTATVADEVGSSKGPATHEYRFPMASFGELLRLASTERKAFEVTPTIVVDDVYRRLFTAAASGYWKLVEREIKGDSNSITATVLTVQNEDYSMLDIAVMFAHDELIEEMVKHLPTESDVDILRKAFFTAARTGRIKMVKALYRAIEGKVDAESGTIEQALRIATQHASKQKEVISYLAKCIISSPNYKTVRCLIRANHLDIVSSLAERFPGLMSSKEGEELSLLLDLVKMASYFCRGAKFNFWEETFYKCITLSLDGASNDDVEDANKDGAFKKFKKSLWNFATKSVCGIKIFRESHLRHQGSFHLAIEALSTKEPKMETPKQVEFLLTSGIVLDAASSGMIKIVWLCLKLYPELMWEKEFTKKLLEEIVRGRHVNLFRVVNTFKPISYLIDDELIRHLMEIFVASQPESGRSNASAAFFMQKEIQWFTVLTDRSSPSLRSLKFEVKRRGDSLSETLTLVEAKESRGKTFWEVLVEERKGLLEEAGKWMKKISSSCILVATLLITVTFTTAFTVPGGYNNSTGIPVLVKNSLFQTFNGAEGLALVFSVSATWIFLSVLTSSYRATNFRHSLQVKMIGGLTLLFLALVCMLVAFTSAYLIDSTDRYKRTYIPLILVFAFLVAMAAIRQQLPLYVGMVIATYRPRLYSPLKLGK